MSTFDPASFLETANIDGPLSTTFVPVPEGAYRAKIDKVEGRTAETKERGDVPIFRVIWEILDDEIRTSLERDKVTVSQDVWLDLTPEGKLDSGKGKNVSLGRLREALGMNEGSGNPFTGMLERVAIIRVTHRSDRNDPEVKHAQVTRVTSLENA